MSGEHVMMFSFGLFCVGSSPRERGAPAKPIKFVVDTGIIPA